MQHIFLGLILITLDFHLNLGRVSIGLLPDFLGYFFLIRGLQALGTESEHFAKSVPFAKVMMIYTGVIYLLDLIGVGLSSGVLSLILGLAAVVARLIILYWLVLGIQEIQQRHGRDLQADKLKNLWLALAVTNGLVYVCSWIPLVNVVAFLAGAIVTICFLVAFNRTKQAWETGV